MIIREELTINLDEDLDSVDEVEEPEIDASLGNSCQLIKTQEELQD